MFFFFKQKTAYEIGTGDWSSDVCSSDLKFAEELAARDRELQQLRMDLDLAKLQTPAPAPGPSEADLLEAERLRLQREEEARRLAELQRRRDEEAAFQEARIKSPTIEIGRAHV